MRLAFRRGGAVALDLGGYAFELGASAFELGASGVALLTPMAGCFVAL